MNDERIISAFFNLHTTKSFGIPAEDGSKEFVVYIEEMLARL